jgi:amidase
MTAPASPGRDFGCFCPGEFDPVAGAQNGPLADLTFAVKDLIDTCGSVSGAGNPDWRRTHAPAARHAAVVQRLLDSGARLIGRTITDELAFSLEGENHFEGTPVNPRCPDRLPGGSSSGSAVAVAAGLADFALGTDTGGSVRVPAAFCGIFGIRPSHGAVSLDGVVPFAPSLDTIGWLAGDAETLARIGDVLLPLEFEAAPQVERVLVAADAFALADAEVADALIATLRRLPFAVTQVNGSPVAMSEVARCYQITQAADIVEVHGAWLEQTRPRFGPAIAPRFASIRRYSSAEFRAAALQREELRGHLSGLFARETGAVLIVPSAPCWPLARGLPGETIGRFYQRALAIGGLASLAGLPQVSIPIVMPGRLPVGLGVIAPAGSDRTLLRMAAVVARQLAPGA